jgi:hypothetical protein
MSAGVEGEHRVRHGGVRLEVDDRDLVGASAVRLAVGVVRVAAGVRRVDRVDAALGVDLEARRAGVVDVGAGRQEEPRGDSSSSSSWSAGRLALGAAVRARRERQSCHPFGRRPSHRSRPSSAST